MDFSKLPRLSKTRTPEGTADAPPGDGPAGDPPPAPVAARDPMSHRRDESYAPLATGRGPEAWISIGVGLIFLFVFPHFTQWWVHVVFHTKTPLPFSVTDAAGDEIPYPKSDFFFNDLAIASFAYALLIEGVALILAGRNRPGIVLFALAVTTAAVALNAWYAISSFGDGFPIVSAIAVVFGGYMMWFQWNLAKELIAAKRGARAFAAARA